MATKRKTVHKKKIQKYWYDKLSNSGSEWVDKLGDLAYEVILEDDGKSCYACGKPDNHLHACHITPHTLEGEGAPENMFLMCRLCHADAPDTIYPDLFFHYVKEKEFHFATTIKSVHAKITSLMAAAEDGENEAFDRFMESISGRDDPKVQMIRDKSIDEIGPGLYNKMSDNSLVGFIWKNFVNEGKLLQAA